MAFCSVHLSSKADAEPLYGLRPRMRLLLRFKLHFQLRELQTEERFDSKTEARSCKTKRRNCVDIEFL